MYLPGQIIFDLDTQSPVQIGSAWGPLPKRNIHFVEAGEQYGTTEIYTPASIVEAKDLLAKGIIQPAPRDQEHCWNCGNWWSNHPSTRCFL